MENQEKNVGETMENLLDRLSLSQTTKSFVKKIQIGLIIKKIDYDNYGEIGEMLSNMVQPENLQWFASKLIETAVIRLEEGVLEKFLEVMETKHPSIVEEVVKAIYNAVNKIFRDIPKNKKWYDSIQMHLENYGSFLGALTLARDRLILFDDSWLTGLLQEAKELRGTTLKYAILFVIQVLRCAPGFNIDKTPFLRPYFFMLKKIYEEVKLSLTLRLEIDSLFKEYNVELCNDLQSECSKDESPKTTRCLSDKEKIYQNGYHLENEEETKVTETDTSIINLQSNQSEDGK